MKEVWGIKWDGCGYWVFGFVDFEIVFVDIFGINEVGGGVCVEMVEEVVLCVDLIFFVVDLDLNEIEYVVLFELIVFCKLLLFVLNKFDFYDWI